LSRVVGLLDREAIIKRDGRKRIVGVEWQALLRRWSRDVEPTLLFSGVARAQRVRGEAGSREWSLRCDRFVGGTASCSSTPRRAVYFDGYDARLRRPESGERRSNDQSRSRTARSGGADLKNGKKREWVAPWALIQNTSQHAGYWSVRWTRSARNLEGKRRTLCRRFAPTVRSAAPVVQTNQINQTNSKKSLTASAAQVCSR